MGRLSKDELAELQNPENWDEEGEIRPPVKAPRAIVSVAFSREDIETVAKHARKHGMKTSEFIRHAAMERAMPRPKVEVETPHPRFFDST